MVKVGVKIAAALRSCGPRGQRLLHVCEQAAVLFHIARARLRQRSRRARPTVSLVIAGRNDDYVADNEARLRLTIAWNREVLGDEQIFVEWNPPPGRPLLSISLAREFPHLRAFIVDAHVHRQMGKGLTNRPFLDFSAKNVGLRRAAGEYVCCTNGDILFDPGVRCLRRLATKDVVIRTRRTDLHWDGRPVTAAYLRSSAHHVPTPAGWTRSIYYGCGDFTLAHRELWCAAGGYDEAIPERDLQCDTRGLMQLQKLGGRVLHMGRHYHLYHASSSTAKTGQTQQTAKFAYWEGLPYQNPPSWGLANLRQQQIEDRVWLISR